MTFHMISPRERSTPATPVFLFGPVDRQVSEDVFAPKWTPAIGCFRARNAALTSSGLVLEPGSILPPTECGFQPQSGALTPLQRISQQTVVFDEVLDHSLRSWWVDVSYRLWVLRQSGCHLGSLTYLLSPRLASLAHGLLSSHGISQSQISIRPQQGLVIEDMLLPTGACLQGSVSPRLSEALAFQAVPAVEPLAGPRRGSFLFVVQDEEVLQDVGNLRELSEMAEQLGYTTGHLGALPDIEQLELLRDASVIVLCGHHASQPTMNCRPGTVVCQLQDAARTSNLVPSAIARSLDQSVGYVFGSSGGSDDASACFRIVPEDFEAALRVISVYRSRLHEHAR